MRRGRWGEEVGEGDGEGKGRRRRREREMARWRESWVTEDDYLTFVAMSNQGVDSVPGCLFDIPTAICVTAVD